MKKHLKWILLFSLIIFSFFLSLPEITFINEGESKSTGNVGKGGIENPYLLPYKGKNFKYFSPISYYILNNGYVNSKVYRSILESYKECEKTCPGVKFIIMECTNKNGGKMLIHKTHQNGLSVDFMVPKKKNNQQARLFDRIGLWHYLLEFTNSGELTLNKKVEIDFETMGAHILALNKACKNNGLRINKVILKIELKDDFFRTQAGKKVKREGIYFARVLPGLINKLHDDHYHVDFEIAN